MTQHICGTCRYFEEGGFAASGRCNHPARREIRMMVLVRKNELACREHWDGGLWEPKETLEPASAATPPQAASALVAEPSIGDTKDQQFTDRVTAVGVAPATRQPAEPVKSPEPVRSRETASAPPAQPVEHVNPVAERPAASSGTQAPPAASGARRDYWSEPTPEVRRAEPDMTARDAFSLSARPSEQPAPPTERPAARLDDSFGRSWGAPRAFDEDQIRPVPPRRADVEPRRDEATPRRADRPSSGRASSFDDLEQFRPRPGTNVPPAAPRRDPDIEQLGSTHPTGGATNGPAPNQSLSGGRRGWTEPFEAAAPAPRRPPEMAMPPRAEAVRRAGPSSEPARTAANPKVAAIKQCCGTCRDFRPADGGERGWCNNQFAFDHRRMVRRNELACRSTIGDWWIPSDDWWLQQADYSHHGRPTPIVDDLLRQLLDARANGTNNQKNGRG